VTYLVILGAFKTLLLNKNWQTKRQDNVQAPGTVRDGEDWLVGWFFLLYLRSKPSEQLQERRLLSRARDTDTAQRRAINQRQRSPDKGQGQRERSAYSRPLPMEVKQNLLSCFFPAWISGDSFQLISPLFPTKLQKM